MNTISTRLTAIVELINAAEKAGIDATELVKKALTDIVENASGVLITRGNYESHYLPAMNQQEIDTAKIRGKLDAIKMYKERTKLSLMDSKLSVEQQFDKLGYTFAGYNAVRY